MVEQGKMPRKMTCVVFNYCSFLVLLLQEICNCCSKKCSLKCGLLSDLPLAASRLWDQMLPRVLWKNSAWLEDWLTLCTCGLKTGHVLIASREPKCCLGKVKLFIYLIWESLSLQSSAVSQLCVMTVLLCLGVISLVQQTYQTTDYWDKTVRNKCHWTAAVFLDNKNIIVLLSFRN